MTDKLKTIGPEGRGVATFRDLKKAIEGLKYALHEKEGNDDDPDWYVVDYDQVLEKIGEVERFSLRKKTSEKKPMAECICKQYSGKSSYLLMNGDSWHEVCYNAGKPLCKKCTQAECDLAQGRYKKVFRGPFVKKALGDDKSG